MAKRACTNNQVSFKRNRLYNSMLYEISDFRRNFDRFRREGRDFSGSPTSYSRNTDLHSSDNINVHRPKEERVKENCTWTTLVETKNDVDRMSGPIEKLQPGLKRGLANPGRGGRCGVGCGMVGKGDSSFGVLLTLSENIKSGTVRSERLSNRERLQF